MAQRDLNLGTPPQGTDGDTVRAAFEKVQANFTELYQTKQDGIEGLTPAGVAFLQEGDAAGQRGALGLGNVDNTSDLDKPVSVATQQALDGKAPLASPALTGNPTAPTPATEDADTTIATTAFVRAAMALFGVGTPNNLAAITADADTLTVSGTYWLNGASPNKPVPQSGQLVVVATPNLNTNSQFFYAQMGTIAPRLFFRQKSAGDGTWNAWSELWHTGNILGTVSQSGGVPTGAIIDRGSNANGEYVRFADGTQECICKATIDFTNFVSQISSGVWSLTLSIPASFSSNGLTTGSVSMLQAGYSANANRFLSRMQVNISALGAPTLYRVDNADMVDAAETREIRVSVRGRWY